MTTEVNDTPMRMSPYEAKALGDIRKWHTTRLARRRRMLPEKARTTLAKAAHGAGDAVRRAPGADGMETALTKALEGLRRVTLDPALRSVRTERVLAAYRETHPHIATLNDIQTLDLEDCDRALPNLRFYYSAAAGAEGAAASVAITGAEVATAVSGGTTAPVVVGAIAADTAAVLAATGRVIAHTAAYYGYDVRQPEEEMFALGIMALASATTQGEKIAAMAAISRLCQQMMRRATWKQLNEHLLVKIISQIYVRLGLRLTKAGLSKAVPVAGAVIGAGMNAFVVQKAAEDARMIYRMRFLTDKYGIDPTTWAVPTADSNDELGDPIMVDEYLDGEVA